MEILGILATLLKKYIDLVGEKKENYNYCHMLIREEEHRLEPLPLMLAKFLKAIHSSINGLVKPSEMLYALPRIRVFTVY